MRRSQKLSKLARAFVLGLAVLSSIAATTAQAQQQQPQKKFKIYLALPTSAGGWLTAASNSINPS